MRTKGIGGFPPRPPNRETLWQTIETGSGNFIVTSNKSRERYYLYAVAENGELQRVASAPTPEGFWDKINTYKE